MKELFHTIDPETSREAIEGHRKRKRNLDTVYDAVRAMPGLTANEYAVPLPMEYMEVRRRLSDLKNKGKVRQGERRKCTVRGSNMVTWHEA